MSVGGRANGALNLPRWVIGAWPPLAYLLLTLGLTWPLPLHLNEQIPRGEPDSWQNIWNFWWLRSALFERGQNPYQTDVLFFPYRDSHNPLGLYYHTLQPTLSLTGSLLSALFNYAFAYNLVIIFGFVATGWAMYGLAYYFIQNRAAAFAAGAFYTFSVYHWHNLAQGQTEIFWQQWLPLYLWLLHRTVAPLHGPNSNWRRDALLAALVLILNTYTNLYFTLYLLLYTGALYLLLLLIRFASSKLKPRPIDESVSILSQYVEANPDKPSVLSWRDKIVQVLADTRQSSTFLLQPGSLTLRFGIILGGWLLLTSPLIVAMLLNNTDPTVRFVEGREVEILQSAALPSLWTPTRGAERTWSAYFLGYSTLLLAAIGLWHSRWRGLGWALLALIALTMALGPNLRLDQNQRPEVALKNLPLPYWLLSKIPLVSNGRSPIRFMALAQLGLALLAGWGVLGLGEFFSRFSKLPRLRWDWKPIIAGLALLIFILETNVWPLALQTLPRPAIFSQLAADPDKTFAILELPITNHYTEDSRRMYFQALHHHPITGGYISRRTEDYDKLAGSPFRQLFGRAPVPADPIFDTEPVTLRLLNFYNLKYVINYRDEYPKDDQGGFVRTEEQLTRLLGTGARIYGDDLLSAYRVPQEGGAEPFPLAASGFYPAQKLEDGRNYRWAGQDAALTIAMPAAGKVQLRLTAWSFTPENTLDLKLNGRTIAQLKLSGAPTEMLTPPLDLPAGTITLNLHSAVPARSPKELGQGDDDRRLAFAFSSVKLLTSP